MSDYRIAIDPGDVHVGWALQCQGQVVAGEWTPNECISKIREAFDMCKREEFAPELILEEFVLYPGKAAEQAGSSFMTSQLIGALKLVASDYGVPVVMQGANIKKPTRKQMAARGIKRVNPRASTHQLDAEEHLWYRILRERERNTNG